MTTKLETICDLGHVEHVEPGLYVVCQRIMRNGICGALIHTRTLLDMPEDEAVRPGPDDSVAPGAILTRTVDVDDLEDDDLLDDEEDLEPVGEPLRDRVLRALQPLAVLLPYRPLLISAAIVSAALTYYFFMKGQWILALLV